MICLSVDNLCSQVQIRIIKNWSKWEFPAQPKIKQKVKRYTWIDSWQLFVRTWGKIREDAVFDAKSMQIIFYYLLTFDL